MSTGHFSNFLLSIFPAPQGPVNRTQLGQVPKEARTCSICHPRNDQRKGPTQHGPDTSPTRAEYDLEETRKCYNSHHGRPGHGSIMSPDTSPDEQRSCISNPRRNADANTNPDTFPEVARPTPGRPKRSATPPQKKPGHAKSHPTHFATCASRLAKWLLRVLALCPAAVTLCGNGRARMCYR